MKLGHCISKPLWYPIVSLRDVLSKRVCVLYHYLLNFKSKAFLPLKIMRIHQVQSWLATENDNQANNSVLKDQSNKSLKPILKGKRDSVS